ncbi:MAG: hypothetical protein MH204_00235, partial [Fimbriimonadaceae bacterium]|nr:hypothetical protein [Fimbriimonadaceae bacterium]
MEFSFTRLKLKKVYPLAISRGSSDGSQNLFVKVRDGDFTGVGEAAPATADVETLAKEAVPSLEALIASRAPEMGPWACWQRGRQMSVHPAALAAIDIALWDLLARKAGLPLHRMLGLERGVIQTSVTVGINPPDRVAELVPEMLHRWKARVLKVKLGSPAGIDHDQESYVAAWKPARSLGVPIRVDANGGWSPADAEKMMRFLAERDCDFVEQPLARGQEDALPELFARRPLPIWLDETVQSSGDIPPIADRCDGGN